MKLLAATLSVVALLAVTAVQFPRCAAAATWALIDENDNSSFYFDKSGVKKHDAGKAVVTTRAVYTKEGKDDALKVLGSYKNMQNLFESQYSYDLDCVEQQSHLLDVKHLDKQGQILKSSQLGGVTDWEDILPDTRLAYVFDEVCPQ
jgi:hypothetical protein